MKNSTPLFLKKTTYYALTAAILLVSGLSSCSKSEDTTTTLNALRVINASPSTATYNAYVGGTRINSAALPLGGTVSYSQRETNNYTIKFTSASTTESLYSKTISLAPSSFQSFYLINRPNALDGLFITDDLSIPDANKAYIRFVNLSPDAPALDLVKKDATTALIANKAYKVASGFVAVDPGAYSFDAKENSSGTVKVSSSSVTLAAGYHYDIVCLGLVTATGNTERGLDLQTLILK
ncbi:DUF4397 domain-containing protein [Pedobacter sp. MW01-1-1]|uniref:DUF4397 domain-containing protein n=1 Tax=Pedobacter sp. MW01-1-1 TaxID=3383027 RepID=UPI003FED9D4B